MGGVRIEDLYKMIYMCIEYTVYNTVLLNKRKLLSSKFFALLHSPGVSVVERQQARYF